MDLERWVEGNLTQNSGAAEGFELLGSEAWLGEMAHAEARSFESLGWTESSRKLRLSEQLQWLQKLELLATFYGTEVPLRWREVGF